MGNLKTLERSTVYLITNGPSAGELGPAVIRTVSLPFEVKLPSGEIIQLGLDIASITKRKITAVGLFTVYITGEISLDYSGRFAAEYDPHTHEGEFHLI